MEEHGLDGFEYELKTIEALTSTPPSNGAVSCCCGAALPSVDHFSLLNWA